MRIVNALALSLLIAGLVQAETVHKKSRHGRTAMTRESVVTQATKSQKMTEDSRARLNTELVETDSDKQVIERTKPFSRHGQTAMSKERLLK